MSTYINMSKTTDMIEELDKLREKRREYKKVIRQLQDNIKDLERKIADISEELGK